MLLLIFQGFQKQGVKAGEMKKINSTILDRN
jgi:hypothetical protein